MRRRLIVSTLLLSAGCASLPEPASDVPGADPVVAGYLAGWGVRSKGTRIADLRAEHLTHLIYAFAKIDENGRAALGDRCLDAGWCAGSTPPESAGGNFASLLELKRRHPHLRMLLAIGGWSGSQRFSDVALTDSSRRAFVASAVQLGIRQWPGVFDGVDVDWEYPVAGGLPENARRPEDRRNFTLLMAEFRRQLDALSPSAPRRYLLTAATSAGAQGVRNLELDSLSRVVDWLNVMTYDYHAGSRAAGFNAPLYAVTDDPAPRLNVDSTVAMYLRAGLPPSHLVIGVPFYARSYGGVGPVNDGLHQAATAAPREWTGTTLDARNFSRARLEANGFRIFTHPKAQAPFAYNPTTSVWITFEDAASMARKADYARARGLRGLMIWELGGDDGSLLAEIGPRLLSQPRRRE